MMAKTANTIIGGTSPKLNIKPCQSIKFLLYTRAISTAGKRMKTMLYKCSTGLRSPLLSSSHAPVTTAGNKDFVLFQTLSGPLSLCVGASSSNSIEFRVKDTDGRLNSSSSSPCSVITSSLPPAACNPLVGSRNSVLIVVLIAWKDEAPEHKHSNAIIERSIISLPSANSVE
mmetsp:Transcript_10087/g.12774  ORF Transcript_10087/g.12774 Transcript_10087/m.12774 type:complete len:172 (+) Transcript_10087:523-1038(+)